MMIINKYTFQVAILIILLLQTAIAISETILDKGHNLGQLRGAMIGSDVSENDILEFGNQWQTNHIRWQLNWADASSNSDIEAYWTWLVVELEKLDNILIYSRNAGIKVLIDLHTTPGGRDSSDANKIFTDQEALDNFYEVWRTIARRYKDNTVVWGYDLVNEPVENSFGQIDTWHNIATHAAQEIRAIDSEHSIIVEPAHYGLPEGFNRFSPINVSGVVYSVHVYDPHRFTHQGLGNFGATGVSYPGFIDGEYWDKNRLIESLAAVLSFQNKYSVPIYVGEFSAIRWAPGDSAFNYISDAIDIFESYGWDWAYHAFREWDGWSVEYPAGTTASTPASSTTKRETLLRSWYAKNTQPKYFYSIYPDENTNFLFSQNRILSCNLPALYNDQKSVTKNVWDVIWTINPDTAIFSVLSATLSQNNCDISVLDALDTSPLTSGYTANFTDSGNLFFSNSNVLRTCNFNATFTDVDENITFNEIIDVDWYFKADDASWRYYNLEIPAQENCLSKAVTVPPD